MDAMSSGQDRITRQAFHEFDRWTRRFSRMLRESASSLATEGRPPGLITSETLVDAVRTTCEQLAAELGTSNDGCSSNGQEDKTAA